MARLDLLLVQLQGRLQVVAPQGRQEVPQVQVAPQGRQEPQGRQVQVALQGRQEPPQVQAVPQGRQEPLQVQLAPQGQQEPLQVQVTPQGRPQPPMAQLQFQTIRLQGRLHLPVGRLQGLPLTKELALPQAKALRDAVIHLALPIGVC